MTLNGNRIRRHLWSCLTCASAVVALAACQSTSTAAAFADDDNDGWFTSTNNLMTVLTLTTLNVMSGSQGRYRVIVDGVRFPNGPAIPLDDLDANNWIALGANGTATLNVAVAKRVQGTNRWNRSLDVGRSAYRSTVKVEQLTGNGITDHGTVTINWSSDGGETRTALLVAGGTSITVTFTSVTTRFSDPNPTNASGDSDGDGMLESEEFALVSAFNGIGDPQPGASDILVVVGFSEPAAVLDPATVEMLKTRFFSRAINLHVDDGTLNGRPGRGGLMTLGGVAISPGTPISIAQTRSIRDSNLPAGPRRIVHFMLLTTGLSTGAFGLTSAAPSAESAMQSHLKVGLVTLPANTETYQTGVFMHELGHQLGLCHPTDHIGMPDATGTFCASIPAPERNPAATAMGSPAETPGLGNVPLLVAQALSRPIDFTPTQWTLLNFVAGMRP